MFSSLRYLDCLLAGCVGCVFSADHRGDALGRLGAGGAFDRTAALSTRRRDSYVEATAAHGGDRLQPEGQLGPADQLLLRAIDDLTRCRRVQRHDDGLADLEFL